MYARSAVEGHGGREWLVDDHCGVEQFQRLSGGQRQHLTTCAARSAASRPPVMALPDPTDPSPGRWAGVSQRAVVGERIQNELAAA